MLELLALAGLGLPWLRGLGSDDGAASASPTGLRVSQLPPWALLPTTVPEGDPRPLPAALAEASAPKPEPAPAPPPGPSIEEIGAQELATTVPPPGITYGENERWILVNTATQRAVAFEGAKPVRVALVTTGMPWLDHALGRVQCLRPRGERDHGLHQPGLPSRRARRLARGGRSSGSSTSTAP